MGQHQDAVATEPRMVPWLICFCDQPGEPRGLHALWTRKKFRHCFAMRYDTRGFYLFMEWSTRGLDVRSISTEEAWRILWAMRNHGEVWEFQVKRMVWRRYWIWTCMTCATACARLLGIKSTVFTPWQLRCALAREGGRRMFRETTEASDGA